MRSLLPISLLIAATLILSGGAAPTHAYRIPSPESVQTIDVTAKKYEFDPSTIRVKQGTRVKLKIHAIDHAHGFRISEMPDGVDTKGNPGLVFASAQDCTKIEEGKSETVEFVAQRSGRYPFRCCVHCGWHHRGMMGELIVEP